MCIIIVLLHCILHFLLSKDLSLSIIYSLLHDSGSRQIYWTFFPFFYFSLYFISPIFSWNLNFVVCFINILYTSSHFYYIPPHVLLPGVHFEYFARPPFVIWKQYGHCLLVFDLLYVILTISLLNILALLGYPLFQVAILIRW